MADDDLLSKQLIAVIDRRTTMCCLRAAGQIRPVDEPYDTIFGQIDSPPFHDHCRSISVPWMPGFVQSLRADANKEIRRRPDKEKRNAPEGFLGSMAPRGR